MTTTGLLLLSALVLLLPRAMQPRGGPEPEVRGGLRVLWWINALYCAGMHRLELKGSAPLPEHGPAILVSNHTCGVDHLLLQAGCHRVLGFLIAQEFYDHWLCRPFCRILGCIPVRRDGRDLGATRAALRALEEGRVVPIFPEGRITPTSGREIGEGRPGAAYIALRAGVPVIPAYIRGTPAPKNVFMALVTPSNARVRFGPPIDLAGEFPGPPKAAQVAATDRIMSAIRALRDESLAPD